MTPDQTKEKVHDNLKQGRHMIIYGSHGIGKNHSVSSGAGRLGIQLISVDSSQDLQERQRELLDLSESFAFNPIAFVFKDAEAIEDFHFIEDLVTRTQYPVVLIMTNLSNKISPKLKAKFDVIRYPEPRLSEVVAIIKLVVPKERQLDFSHVTTDIRQSILNVQVAAESYAPESTIEELELLFLRGTMSQNLEKHRWLWLLVYHNIPHFYLPPVQITAFEILRQAEYYDKPQLLTLLPKGKGKAVFPKNLGRR